MSDQVLDEVEGRGPQTAEDGELVHWMAAKPLRLGPAGMGVTAGAAFTVGVLATLGIMALIGWLGPEREVEAPRRWRWRG
jgi:hypothetical protein